jgi:hypothetical protein
MARMGLSVFGEILRWSEDWNAADGAQDQQIPVAGEDQVGAAIDGFVFLVRLGLWTLTQRRIRY